MSSYKFIAVIASTNNGVIGDGDKIPWHYPKEISIFQNIIADGINIMGMKTFMSVCNYKWFKKQSLNIVFTKNIENAYDEFHIKSKKNIICNNVLFVSSFNDLYLKLEKIVKIYQNSNFFVIGGANILTEFLKRKLLSGFYLTIISKEYKGDVILDMNYINSWKKSDIIYECDEFSVFYFTPY